MVYSSLYCMNVSSTGVPIYQLKAERWSLHDSPPRKTAVKHFWADALSKHFDCCHAVRHVLAVLFYSFHPMLCEQASIGASENDLIIGVSPNNITSRRQRRVLEFRTWQKDRQKREATREKKKERDGHLDKWKNAPFTKLLWASLISRLRSFLRLATRLNN